MLLILAVVMQQWFLHVVLEGAANPPDVDEKLRFPRCWRTAVKTAVIHTCVLKSAS